MRIGGLTKQCLALAACTFGLVLSATPLVSQERIVNGDFEQGSSGFTSDYSFSPGNLWPGATYDVLRNPLNAHPYAYSYGDHTSGQGLMLAVNGALWYGPRVWSQTVLVGRHMPYVFSLWISSWVPDQPAVLEIRFNGILFATVEAPGAAGVWQHFSVAWDSGDSDYADIAIIDLNTEYGGNDFALDDISLTPGSTGVDPFTWGQIKAFYSAH